MKHADEVAAGHKMDTIANYLLKVFPGAVIRSTRVNGRDYLTTVGTPDPLDSSGLPIWARLQ